MSENDKELTIHVVATNDAMVSNLQQVFSKRPGKKPIVYMTRVDHELRLNRINLEKDNILIIDSEKISQFDIEDMALLHKERIHPYIIYLASSWTENQLIDLMRVGVNEIIHLPLNGSSQDLLDAIERIQKRVNIAVSSKPKGKIISCISSKGGAGATMIAINLAYLLSQKFQKKILFIDLHLQYGDSSYYLSDTIASSNVAEIVTQPYLNSVTIAASAIQVADNLYLLPSSNSIEKSSNIQADHIDTLLTVAAYEYDYVFIDLNYVLTSNSIRALDRSELIYIITQPTLAYLKSLVNLLGVFSELSYPEKKIKIVMNKCDVDAALPIEKVNEIINRKVYAEIPFDLSAVDESINAGVPIVKMFHLNKVSKAIEALANFTEGKNLVEKPESMLSQIFHLNKG